MPSPGIVFYGSLLIIPSLLSHCLPIAEDAIISSGPPRLAMNASAPGSTSSSLSHSQLMSEGRPLIETEDSENPSLLTSIPTFAPPAAIKRRGDDRNDVGINVPTPIITIGIPSVKTIRQYISARFRKKLRRSPSAQYRQPLPPVPTDAVQPHKVPIPDSTFNFVTNAKQHRDPNPSDHLNDKNGTGESDSDMTANNAIQSMASSGTALETPIEPDSQGVTASGNPQSHSLSHTLGTISHAQYEEEDNGKKRRKDKRDEDLRKRAPDSDDGGFLGDDMEDEDVPTIWNGQVDLDDLDWYEIQELDDWLDTLAFMQKHNVKGQSRNSSSSASPTVNQTSSMSPSSAKSTVLAPPPKSLAKTLRLKPHSSLQNKTHRGNRRAEISRPTNARRTAKTQREPRSTKSKQTPLAKDIHLILRREDEYDPKLEPIDISDEAFDEFRKLNPSFFGGGWRKEKRGSKSD